MLKNKQCCRQAKKLFSARLLLKVKATLRILLQHSFSQRRGDACCPSSIEELGLVCSAFAKSSSALRVLFLLAAI